MTPQTEQALLEKAWSIAGQTLGELAEQYQVTLPENLRTHKGWVGDLIETALGAAAGSLPEPDFPHLSIELKTIPVRETLTVAESTHVCNINLREIAGTRWEDSLLYKKLLCVLWVPIQHKKNMPLADRQIGSPFLWRASEKELDTIRRDWEELIEMLTTGQQEHVSAHMGQVLQVRPKAANSYMLTDSHNASGLSVKSLPRGFYLRPEFTNHLLNKHFHSVK